MKNLASIFILSLLLFSCGKTDFKKDWDKGDKSDCEQEECTACADGDYEDPDVLGEGVTKYVLEDFKYDERGCITEGYIKYLKDGVTVALVKYWSKDGVTYGCKTICVYGDCFDEEDYSCKFEVECVL
ncbi:MAG: hypothetical protein ACI857_002398 [Arenicella sp.]|jgi:hypothetical protein